MRTLTLVLFLLFGAPSAAGSEASDAYRLYKQARKAEKAGQVARAYILYTEAAALDPNRIEYTLRGQALQSRAALQAKSVPKPADAEAEPDIIVEPEPHFDSPTARDYAEARKPLPPTELQAAAGRQDFDLHGDNKSLFERVAKAFGLDCVFDYDYQPGANIHFEMRQADYREALHAMEAVTASFVVPLSTRVFLVVKDTPQKRKETEPSVSITIPLPEPYSVQDLTALIAAVQQSMALEKVAWDTQKNMVVIRDRISKVTAARQLFEQLLQPRPQVEIEVEFMEISNTDLLNYGLTLPTSFPVVTMSKFLRNVPSIPSGISGLALFGGGASLFGIAMADVQLMANMSKSTGQTLLNAELRSVDNLPATLHVGNRYPILTSGYFGPASFSNGGQVYTPPPSFTYEDLGFSLKVTPHIHGMAEVALDLETEFKLLSGAALNGIPIVANRQLKSTVTLKDGEWAIVAGMMNASDARTISGIAGIANLPLVGRFLRQTTKEKDDQQVLIVIKPRLLTTPPTEVLTREVRVGSEERPFIPL